MTPADLIGLEIFGLPISSLALGILALTVLPALWRVTFGPSNADRAVGADHVYYVLVATLAILGLAWGRHQLMDLVIVATLIGFISALILGRYLGSGRGTDSTEQGDS